MSNSAFGHIELTTVGGGGGGVGLTWSTITESITAVTGNAYICNHATVRVIVTLPALCVVGDTVKIAGQGAAGWQLSAYTGDFIQFGSLITTSGGYLQSTNQFNSVEVTCISADSVWLVTSGVGNLTVA